jgi:hypothetical protein
MGKQPRARYVWVALCVLATWCSSEPTSADILIESHLGARPTDADRVLEPMRAALARSGVKIDPVDVVAEAGGVLPLPGAFTPPQAPSYPADPSEQVELGTTQVLHADYDAGLATLGALLEAVRANPARVIADPSSPRWLTKAYAVFAFAQLRTHHVDAATQAIADQIRSFPDDPIGRVVGPEIATLAETVRKTLDGSPHGSLRVTVSPADVQIALDEHGRGQGRLALHLVTGTYRLLLVRAGVARRYSVVVAPDRTTNLQVDWEADTAFDVARSWLGFVWPRGQGDRTDAAVARYARGGRQHDIFVASIVTHGDRRFVTGAIFEKSTGVVVRRKAIELGHDDATCGRALAQYLLKGDLSACLVDLSGDAVHLAATVGVHAPSRDPYLVPGIVAGAGAIAAISGIGVLVGKHDPQSGQGGPSYLSWPGVGLVVAGGLAIGTATYLATRVSGSSESPTTTTSRRSRAPIYASAATAIAAFVVGGYLLHINGTGTCTIGASGQCFYRYRSAPAGGALIGAGVAAAGFGLYWQLSAPRDSTPAGVALGPTRGGAAAGIAGSF